MNMINSLNTICTKYLLSKIIYVESYYRNIAQYINRSKMTVPGIWGTDLELFAASILFDVDIWVYLGYSIAKWQLFSRSGFDLSKTFESPSNEGIYLLLKESHYTPILEVKYNQSPDNCIYFDNGSEL